MRADILMVIAFSTPKFNSIPRLSLNILDGERGKRHSPSLESEAAPQGLAEFHVTFILFSALNSNGLIA